MDRTASYPETSNIKARIYRLNPNNSVSFITGSSVINQIRLGDQINPNLSYIPNENRLIFAWESNSIASAGGYGLYTRITDSALNPITGDIRMNDNNTIKSDWEEDGGYATLCDLWSDHVGLSCNLSKDCYVAWNNPDYQCSNCDPIYSGYASHGKGYSIKSASLIECPLLNRYVVNNNQSFTSTGIQQMYEFSWSGDILTINYATYNENLHFDHYIDISLALGESSRYSCGTDVIVHGNVTISQGSITILSGTLTIN
jgi:hypothetical protein